MSRYAALDDRIVGEIARGANTTALLYALVSLRFVLDDHLTGGWRESPRRAFNRRLQALRKRGVIRFDTEKRTWRAA